MKIDNVLKHNQTSELESTVEKKEGRQGAESDDAANDMTHKKVPQSVTTYFTPKGNESGPETDETKAEKVKVARLQREQRLSMERASTRERHELIIQELERKVEQLSGQVQSLQEENRWLGRYAASLDTKLKKAKADIDVESWRVVYILRRFHEMYRSKLERRSIEDNVPYEKEKVEGKLNCSPVTFCL